MMPADRQLVNPFFTGGETISDLVSRRLDDA